MFFVLETLLLDVEVKYSKELEYLLSICNNEQTLQTMYVEHVE